jgi:hypothetical protein
MSEGVYFCFPCRRGMGLESHQGIPTCNRICTTMKLANTPRVIAEEIVVTSSQVFNLKAGQSQSVRPVTGTVRAVPPEDAMMQATR